MGRIFYLALLCLCISYGVESTAVEGDRESKMYSIFNVVKFPNDVCKGSSSKNGTCYTAEECKNRKGTSSGSCASGYGVCCIISLACGETSSENTTYLATPTTIGTTCDYKICPVSKNICRIRFDMTTFSINLPSSVTTAPVANSQYSIGHCTQDSFSVTGSSGGTPVICGKNTGQHMIVDSDGSTCSIAAFTFGGDTYTRSYDIKVTQYDCRNPDSGGPPGCLQYHTATSGTIGSFNFPLTATTVDSTSTDGSRTTHLANQDYEICFRRVSGKCAVCFAPSFSAAYGLGISGSATAAAALTGSSCTTDFIGIPNGNSATIAVIQGTHPAVVVASSGLTRYCGEILALKTAATAAATVCTGAAPLRVRVYTDGYEVVSTAGKHNTDETKAPGGIVGFLLKYTQDTCK